MDPMLCTDSLFNSTSAAEQQQLMQRAARGYACMWHSTWISEICEGLVGLLHVQAAPSEQPATISVCVAFVGALLGNMNFAKGVTLKCHHEKDALVWEALVSLPWQASYKYK